MNRLRKYQGAESHPISDLVRTIFDDSPSVFGKANKPIYSAWQPLSDIYEKDDNFIISMDLPGISVDDIKLTAEEDALIIAGSRNRSKEIKDEYCYRNERYFGSFEKVFNIPDNIDKDKIQAKYNNGVLKIILPKMPKAKKQNIKIDINKK